MKTYLIRFSLILLLGTFACSCQNDPWTGDQKSAFLESCEEEGGTPGYCDCFLQQAMDRYPVYEDALGMSFEEAVELSLACE